MTGGEHDCLTFPGLHEPENSIDRINLLALRQGNKCILSAVSPQCSKERKGRVGNNLWRRSKNIIYLVFLIKSILQELKK